MSGAGQLSRWLFLQLLFGLALLCACPGAVPTQPGPDVFVGRPQAGEAATEAPPRSGALWYRIEPEQETIAVQLRLLDPPAQTTFFLPGPWAGSDDFDRLILLGGASGPDGPLSMVVDRGAGRIDIDAPGSAWVELSYRVRAPTARGEKLRLYPHSGPESFFAYAPTILVLPSAGLARQLRQIPVEVHLPRTWALSSTWPIHQIEERRSRQIAGFIAADIRTLRDAFVGAGADWRPLEETTPAGDVTLTLAGQFALEEQKLRQATAMIAEFYLQRFGRYQRLEGLVLPVERGARNYLRGMGRYGGFVLEISPAQIVDDDFLILLAHELFHSWNGHELVPAPTADRETRWFKEGLTHYIALKTLTRLGLLDDRALRRELAASAQYYERNPLISGGSARHIDKLRLPYDQGVLMALAIDQLLFEASQGTLEVEDWIETLLSPPFLAESAAYDLRLLERSFAAMTAQLGPHIKRHFQNIIQNRRALDLERLFQSLGLYYLQPTADEPPRLLPLQDRTIYHQIYSPERPGSLE